MNRRSQQVKGEARLAASETLLRRSLLEVLPVVADSGGTLFFNSKYNRHNLPKHQLSDEAEALMDLALACIDLRKHLGLPLEGSVGQLFLGACDESSSSNEHRRGPRKLAQSLLEGLQ
jgi:hypothetical protein